MNVYGIENEVEVCIGLVELLKIRRGCLKGEIYNVEKVFWF